MSDLRPVDDDSSPDSTAPAVEHSSASTTIAGSRWGPLELIERIGEGAFGEVFRALDTNLRREVALKLGRPRAGDASEEAARILEEARRLARVRHANVITIYGAEEHGGRLGIWMDLIRGTTLEEALVRQGPMGAHEAAATGMVLCQALAAVHAAGLVHRDVKTTNVMRETGGRIVLMDFGSGRDFSPGSSPIVSLHVHGTPVAMAPEQWRGEVAGAPTDIYGLGVLLYRLLSGHYPIEAATIGELAEKRRSGDIVPLRDWRPDLPGEIVGIVDRAMAAEPTQRYATAGSMEAALAGFMSRGAEAESAATGSRPSRRGWAASLGVGLGLAAIVILGTILLVPGRIPILRGRPSQGLPGTEPRVKESVGSAPIGRRDDSPQRNAPRPALRQTPADARVAVLHSGNALHATSATRERVTASAEVYRQKDGVETRLLPGARVSPGDLLSMVVESPEAAYFYVLDEDEKGSLFVLFPLPGLQTQNPLPGGTQHRLPGIMANRLLHWKVSAPGGAETMLAIASRVPLTDLERDLASLPHASYGTPVDLGQLSAGAARSLRAIGGLEPSPLPGDDAPKMHLSDALKAIPEDAPQRQSTWYWQAQFQNPVPGQAAGSAAP